MKTWVKGGLIFLGVIAILFVYGVFGGARPCIPEECKAEYLPLGSLAQGIVSPIFIPLTPVMLFLSSFVSPDNLLGNILGFVILIVYLFGVGALIGFIVGKIKSNKGGRL